MTMQQTKVKGCRAVVTMQAAVMVVVMQVVMQAAHASPMFGAGGMMQRRFPGSSDMSYNTYMQIANSRARGAAPAPAAPVAPAVAARFGGSQDDENISETWMFDNEVRDYSANRPSSYQPGGRYQSNNAYVFRYPTQFNPRESYANLQFPYDDPVDVQYRKTINSARRPQQYVYGSYYY